ncbi:MAG: bifunctional 5,10-methylenetetrahydrofolate dehydrogenase/5,10-methenyltetrahydrofolate cyclohydrolase [Leptospiraceae bacterium]|nr:bifunctional 5,10-methylenetetrahydrofolate dehydrogenase/5,10-methenyltetrahydrofolate cyclohydrolase [Leptospiraceae bacterium]
MDFKALGIPKAQWVEGNILRGNKLAQEIRKIIKEKISSASQKPGLAVILVGENPASVIYVNQKEKAAREVGFHSQVLRLPSNTTENEILSLIQELNDNPLIHAILVQLPLPPHLHEEKILQSILPQKDVDGFHYENVGKLYAKNPTARIPCTPLGIFVMLSLLEIPLVGLHAVVLGRSRIVGKPMAQLLLDYCNTTVTMCHSKTKHLDKIISSADILVSAMGQQDVVKSNWVKEGAIIIDVGIHRKEGKLEGDLNFEELCPKASYITPVPGGVGPMTIAMLLWNTLQNFHELYGL